MRRGRIRFWLGTTAAAVAALMVATAGPAMAAAPADSPVERASGVLVTGDNPISLLQRGGFFTAAGAAVYRRPVDGTACIFLLDLCRQSEARQPGDPAPLRLSTG